MMKFMRKCYPNGGVRIGSEEHEADSGSLILPSEHARSLCALPPTDRRSALFQMSPPETLIVAVILILATGGIGALCWVWMTNSRASQKRMESNDARLIALIEEQNALLRRLVDRS
jgi:hypothetical protein